MHWYLDALWKSFDFTGRARRKEYWSFVLWSLFVGFALFLVDGLADFEDEGLGPRPLSLVYTILSLVATLAVTVRRLPDTGRRSNWLLALSIPIVGQIAILVCMLEEGQPGENRYGRNPKEAGG